MAPIKLTFKRDPVDLYKIVRQTRAITHTGYGRMMYNCEYFRSNMMFIFLMNVIFPGVMSPTIIDIAINSDINRENINNFLLAYDRRPNKPMKYYAIMNIQHCIKQTPTNCSPGGHTIIVELDGLAKTFTILDVNAESFNRVMGISDQDFKDFIVTPVNKIGYSVAFGLPCQNINTSDINNYGLCASLGPYALLDKLLKTYANVNVPPIPYWYQAPANTTPGTTCFLESMYSSLIFQPNAPFVSRHLFAELKNFYNRHKRQLVLYEWIFSQYDVAKHFDCPSLAATNITFQDNGFFYSGDIQEHISWVENNTSLLKSKIPSRGIPINGVVLKKDDVDNFRSDIQNIINTILTDVFNNNRDVIDYINDASNNWEGSAPP